jgi:hypothetical protein
MPRWLMWAFFFGLAAATSTGAAIAALSIHPDHAGSGSELALWAICLGTGLVALVCAGKWYQGETKETQRKRALIQFPTEAWSITRVADSGRLRISTAVDIFLPCVSIECQIIAIVGGQQVLMDKPEVMPHLRRAERTLCEATSKSPMTSNASEASVRLFVTLDNGFHNRSPVHNLVIPSRRSAQPAPDKEGSLPQ